MALGLVCGAPDRGTCGQIGTAGSPRRVVRIVVKVVAHGHRVGSRSVSRPARLTSRAGSARSRVRIVRATISWSVWWPPRWAVQRIMLWARIAIWNHAEFAENTPDGRCSSPALALRSRIASSTTACSRWNRSTSTTSPSRSVKNAWCRQSGHSFCCVASVTRVRRTIIRRVTALVPRPDV